MEDGDSGGGTPPPGSRPRRAPNVRPTPGGPAAMKAPTFPLEKELGDRYRCEGILGRGGMATVYLAQDLRHGRQVALKVLLPELAVALGRERFQREIHLTAQLTHPNILPVFDSGQSAEYLWYTMPHAAGGSLRARMDQERQLPVEAALQIAREVSDALSYAHAHGVIHRDIKPENILFCDGHATVADFGIARAIGSLDTDQLTQTGMGLGTPHYMSPEQSMGERGLDGRSDLYALGCVLYEMLAGEPPYTGATAHAIIAKRLSLPVPSVRTLRETVPAGVDRALITALAKAPADRFATTQEFVAALAADPHATIELPQRAGRARIRRRHIVIAVLLALAAAVGWTLLRASSIPPAASVIAVFPFAPTTTDTALTRLGRDLAGTVSASLDGLGEIRTIDRVTIMAQTPEGGAALSLSAAAAMAQRLGASSVVHGSLSRDGGQVRLDVGLFTADSLKPLGRGTVLAAADSLSALTDTVVWRLLAEIWRYGRAPTPTLQAITTRSVPALRAYLDGERFLVAGSDSHAKAAYGRAIAADSSFWFAYFRYSHPAGWHDKPDSAIKAAYWSHRQLLPERERMLIEASDWGDSGLTWQRKRLEALVQRYPDYSPGWWLLGDQLLHAYPHIGATPEDARTAFEHVVALTPNMVLGWHHLAWAGLKMRDTATVARATEALLRLGTFPAFGNEDATRGSRTWLALQRRNRLAGPLLDSLYHETVNGERDVFETAIGLNGEPAVQIALNQRMLRHGLPPEDTQTVKYLTSLIWAMRGAWDSALVIRDQLVRSPADTVDMLFAYQTAVLAAWVGAMPATEALRRRPAVAPLGLARGPGWVAEMAWLDGILAVTNNDMVGLIAARAALKVSGGKWTAYLDRSLSAFEMALRGDRRAAASTMVALERELAEGSPFFVVRATPHALLRGVDRLAAAEWLLDQGDGVQALPLLQWHRALGAFDDKIPLAPLAFLLTAKIEEAQGDTAAARYNYEEFLHRFDMPMPPQRRLVVEARDALARLSGATPPITDR